MFVTEEQNYICLKMIVIIKYLDLNDLVGFHVFNYISIFD